MIVTASHSGAQVFNGRTVTLNFGTGSYDAQVVVSDTTVTSNQGVLVTLLGTDESAIIDNIEVGVINYIAGTGYTVFGSSPFGSVGNVTVYCQVINLS